MGTPDVVSLLRASQIGHGPNGVEFECGRCGTVLTPRAEELITMPAEIPGVESARQRGIRCWKCGLVLQVGFDSDDLRRLADKARSTPQGAERAAAIARYVRAHRRLQQRGRAAIGGRNGPS